MRTVTGKFHDIFSTLRYGVVYDSERTDVGMWQSMDVSDNPLLVTHELRNVAIVYDMPADQAFARLDIEPNMPWAEDHFLERVAGEPVNPGVQYKNWPYYKGNVEQHQTQADEAFSHTYMERYWPKMANVGGLRPNGRQVFVPHNGIRFEYGELDDVVEQLRREPLTRQAYLPVWFPEDTGAVHGERVPCSLGYQFLIRNGKFHCNYFIRSCDLLRHFRDDVYLTTRLAQWVWERTREFTQCTWMGELTMFMSSLHVFEGDLPRLKKEMADHGA